MITIGVTGVGGGVGQAILRSLGHSNLDVRTVGMDASAHNSGIHWAHSGRLLPRVVERDRYRTHVLEIVKAEGIDVLIPGLDPEVSALAEFKDDLRVLGCTLIAGSTRANELAADKLATSEWADARGLPFAPSTALSAARLDPHQFSYPVIVKPRSGSASRGISLARNAQELLESDSDSDFIVQPYLAPRGRDLRAVPGSPGLLVQENEVSAQYVIGRDGRVLGSFVSLNRLKAGVPIQIEPIVDEPWADDGRDIVEALALEGARGPINLQGRLTEAGRVSFFEVNARFTGITGVRAMMGFREVEAAVRSLHLGDDAGAARVLRFDSTAMGFRHVGDMIVASDRVAALEQRGHREAVRRPQTVIVSGGSGYVGLATLELLLSDDTLDEVQVLVRDPDAPGELATLVRRDPRVRLIPGELLSDELSLPDAEVLIHLAAKRADPSHRRPQDLYAVNAEGTRLLAERACAQGIPRIVYASSQAVYGTQRRPLWAESMPPRPGTPYATSKLLGEHVIRASCHDQVVQILRLARVYGRGLTTPWEQLPQLFARRVVAGEPLILSSGGSQRLDLIHVRDVAAAIVAAAVEPLAPAQHRVLNIGSGNPVSLHELAGHYVPVARALGLPEVRIEIQPPADEPPPDFGMDIRRARAQLGWAPHVRLSEGVEELVRTAATSLGL